MGGRRRRRAWVGLWSMSMISVIGGGPVRIQHRVKLAGRRSRRRRAPPERHAAAHAAGRPRRVPGPRPWPSGPNGRAACRSARARWPPRPGQAGGSRRVRPPVRSALPSGPGVGSAGGYPAPRPPVALPKRPCWSARYRGREPATSCGARRPTTAIRENSHANVKQPRRIRRAAGVIVGSRGGAEARKLARRDADLQRDTRGGLGTRTARDRERQRRKRRSTRGKTRTASANANQQGEAAGDIGGPATIPVHLYGRAGSATTADSAGKGSYHPRFTVGESGADELRGRPPRTRRRRHNPSDRGYAPAAAMAGTAS